MRRSVSDRQKAGQSSDSSIAFRWKQSLSRRPTQKPKKFEAFYDLNMFGRVAAKSQTADRPVDNASSTVATDGRRKLLPSRLQAINYIGAGKRRSAANSNGGVARLRRELTDLRREMADERQKLMDELSGLERQNESLQNSLRTAEESHRAHVEAYKRKHWCVVCLQEAVYYCCWSGLYCGPRCQQSHWNGGHKSQCARPQR